MEMALAINGSPKNNGPTHDALAAATAVLEKNGMNVEIAELGDMEISGCLACMRCRETGICAIDDGMTALRQKIIDADVLIWGAPIMNGKEPDTFKRFLDRLYSMVSFSNGEQKADLGKRKKGSIILTCTEPDGDMLHQDSLVRMMSLMRFFGISDLSGAVIPDLRVNGTTGSQLFKDYIDALEFQIW